jgi:PIN domain nuclease of toxin-antitoxin system
MRLLLDTNIVLLLPRQDLASRYPGLVKSLADSAVFAFVSVASLWEIAIKVRLGKLEVEMPLDDLTTFLQGFGIALLRIEASHALATVDPEPNTRDPFDRLLLAQCQVEGLKLITLDRALQGHRLAFMA